MPTRILLASEHAIVREGLRALLEERGEVSVVGQASGGQETLELVDRLRPEIVLMDVWMRGVSAPDVVQRIARSGSKARVLILATHADRHKLRELLRAGASGCLLLEAEPSEIFSAIDALRRGHMYLSPGVAQHVIDSLTGGRSSDSPLACLTNREREVLQLIAEGQASREIAARIGVSIKTVESHRASVMKKLQVHKVSALVRIAIQTGLIRA